jgi:hypothetical protein
MAYPKPKRAPTTLRANVSQSGFGALRSFSHLPLESRMANLVQSLHLLMLCVWYLLPKRLSSNCHINSKARGVIPRVCRFLVAEVITGNNWTES